MSQRIDIVNMKFNHLTVLEDLGGGKVVCQCDCENKTILECYKKNIKSGRQKSCGCASRKKNIENIVGKQFGNWIVTQELGYGKVLCECKCKDKTVKELYKKALINGQTKSCGCLRDINCSKTKQETGSLKSKYIGHKFGEWTVLDRVPNTMKLQCRCSCGTEKEVYIQHLMDGTSKSCGHNNICNIKNMKFGHWTVIEEIGNGKVLCKCECGNANNRILYKQTLIRGQSRSCGCMSTKYCKDTLMQRYNDICTLKIHNPREQWQIDVIKSKESLGSYIKSLKSKPTIEDLANNLNVTRSVISKALHSYELFDAIQLMNNKSYMEIDLCNYIKSIYKGKIIQGDRDVLDSMELDIYLPEKKIAIEFNGNYWHSDTFKDKYYHLRKTLMCSDKGIQLIHIYEYEWCNNTNIIQNYLYNILCNKHTIYGRNTTIKEVEYNEIKDFLNDNHIQGCIASNINIALYERDNIVGLMTFGKPRFDTKAEYELLRLCFLHNINILGGTEKMFSFFIKKYKPNNIVSYCNLDKFTGNIYTKLGFKVHNKIEPNYIWCDKNNNIVSRYQAQRHKLTKLGFTNTSMTEEDIMRNLDFFKIYTSGNLKFIWNNN